ncbi:MAG: alpha/beta hydrolase-fold protein [Clostridia bacterium]|nr:alpha/beta hydrolase-fold protein [Clostridia bacterium]
MKKLISLMLALLMTVMAGAALGASYEGYTQEEFDALDRTTVIKSEDSPTGYYVTFRYSAPDANRVRIRGEWSFATDRGSFYPMSDNIMPEDYQDGMFPLQVNQSDWPAFDMEKNEQSGIWSYTIALPSGTWSYRFIVDGLEGAALTDYTDAFVETDPNNRPMEKDLGEQNNSQVRVPFDAEKQSLDLSVQLPREDGMTGSVAYHIYEAVGVEAELRDDPAIAVYTPYGYDAGREEPYNVLYLSHGAGVESEMSWWNKGSAGNIMDNLIADYGVEPFVVVLINNYAVNFDYDNLTENIVPLVEANYNVSTERTGKAVAGFSMGGVYSQNQMLHHPDQFGYYGLFSGGFFNDEAVEPFDAEALEGAKIYLAAGSKEFGLLAIQRTSAALTEAGVTGYHSYVQTGGHDWPAIRQIYVDFVLNELFK